MRDGAVRPANPEDSKAAVEALAAAFATDPIVTWILRGRRDPQASLRMLFGAMLREAFRQPDQHVYVSDDLSAAAFWAGPDRWKMSPGTMIRLTPASLRSGFVRLGPIRLNAAAQKVHPHAPHYYLQSIGTRPDRQGKGFGSKLLQRLVESCEAEGVGAYLESSNPRNLAFYSRYGFVAQPPFPLPSGCPPYTPMWCAPRGDRM